MYGISSTPYVISDKEYDTLKRCQIIGKVYEEKLLIYSKPFITMNGEILSSERVEHMLGDTVISWLDIWFHSLSFIKAWYQRMETDMHVANNDDMCIYTIRQANTINEQESIIPTPVDISSRYETKQCSNCGVDEKIESLVDILDSIFDERKNEMSTSCDEQLTILDHRSNGRNEYLITRKHRKSKYPFIISPNELQEVSEMKSLKYYANGVMTYGSTDKIISITDALEFLGSEIFFKLTSYFMAGYKMLYVKNDKTIYEVQFMPKAFKQEE